MDGAYRTLAGRYELLEVLGRGGMGVVYRATDLVLDRTVAVKVLPAVLAEAQPTRVARFEREARAAASLNHPGVVAVYDTGVDEATRFIVMECVSGRSLAAILYDQAPFAAARAANVAERVADALAAAHTAGLVHRDVKPGNVMLDAEGSVKVLDFGIARALDGTTLTHDATVLGSAAYMAPEQALGERADERSDIYSLGCLLYAMLTGRPPFGGDAAAAVLNQHINTEPQPPSETNPHVSPALDALVMEMLAKSPGSRPQSAAQVRDRLAVPQPTTTPTLPTALPETTAVTRVLDSAARTPRRRVAIGAGIAGFALLAAVILALTTGGTPRRPRSTARHGSTTSHRTPTRVSTRTSASGSSPPTTTTSAAASAPAPSPTVAARAITSLIAQYVESSEIDRQAAQQITNRLTDILGSYEIGHTLDAQHKLAALSQATTMLESHGDISPSAGAPLNSALSDLAVALARPIPPTPPQAEGSPPNPAGGPPGHGGQPPGQVKKHKDSHGNSHGD